jgi:hypothetical protein
MVVGSGCGLSNQSKEWQVTTTDERPIPLRARDHRSGMRTMGHVYHALGDFLPAFAPPKNLPPPFPEGWEADPEAFQCGFDLSTTSLTGTDRSNLTAWYERTIGYVPKSLQFALNITPTSSR